MWSCLGSLESIYWDTDLLIGNKSRADPTQRFLSSSAQGASLVPAFPKGNVGRPSGSNCASNGQAPGELPGVPSL